MSGKAGSIGSIVLGVIVGAVAIFTPGAQPLLGLSATLMIGSGVYGLTQSPKVTDFASAQSQEMQYNPAAIGTPVPVVFGRKRVNGNWIRYDWTEYEKEPYYGETTGGGKGSKKKQPKAGDKHKLTYEIAWCLGPVDETGQYYSSPGEVPMIDAEGDAVWTTFTDDEPEEFELAPKGTDGAFEGGLSRSYPGSYTQTRIESSDPYYGSSPNYRGIHFDLMGLLPSRFILGTSSYAKSYSKDVGRYPKCVRDNGTTVTGIKVRGSNDSGNVAYYMANPVAIVYECMIDKEWGRGLSSDIINEENFIEVSEFLAEKNIGMSVLLDSPENIGDFLNMIYEHCKLTLNWDGELYTIKCLLDIETTHGAIQTLDEGDYSRVAIQVPSWLSVINELRAEFINIARNGRNDVAHVQNDSAISILNRIVTRRIQLPGFTDYNLALQQAIRLLAESSYPFRPISVTINRFKSQIAVGEVVRLIVRQGLSSPATIYFMALKIDYGGPDDDDVIQITGIEDLILPPVPGIETSVTLPTLWPWERLTIVPPEDVDLSVPIIDPEDFPPLEQETTLVWEVPPILTEGQVNQIVLGVERYPALSGLYVQWSLNNVKFFQFEGNGGMGGCQVISVTLLDDLPGDQYWDRSEAGFEFDINQPVVAFRDNNRLQLLRASAVNNPWDDLNDLLMENRFYMVLGEELIQIGKIEFISGATCRMRNIIRGRFGTQIRQHNAGTVGFYSENQLNGINASQIPQNKELWLLAQYQTYRGAAITKQAVQPFHYPPNDNLFLGAGIRPMSPTRVSIVEDLTTVTVRVRPRLATAGAGVYDFETALKNPVTSLDGMTFSIARVNSSGTLLDPTPVPNDFTHFPGDLVTPGYVELVIEKRLNVRKFLIYSVQRGQTSIEYAELSL